MINKKRVRNVDANLTGINENETFYVAKKVADISADRLVEIGFPANINEGICILGRGLGSASRFNVYGSYRPLKNLPKIVKFQEMCIKDWHGNHHYIDWPRQCYQREEIPAPNIEMETHLIDGEMYILSGPFQNNSEMVGKNKAAINMFLEYFGNCDILDDSLHSTFHDIPIRRVNWELLPAGEYPWERIPADGIKQQGPSQQKLQKHKFDTITRFHPERITIGTGGFRGYIVFEFPNKGLSLLEHMLYGNATYVFDNNWENYSQLTKSEIINGGFNTSRLEHRQGWENRIAELLR